MVVLEVCNLCGGQGFVHFYHALGNPLEECRDMRPCPSCQGAGSVEPWRQVATGVTSDETWTSAPPYRLEEADLAARIRQWEE